ncbi:MAG: CDP-diacylglycerol--glycerol-3-phosphate 3-phosphatidyltransferase [Planctomycetota bacterium]
MSVANQITMGRLVLAIGLFTLMTVMDVNGQHGVLLLIISMLLFVAVVASDALDGYYARKYKQVSDFGRVADPAVDKIVVCGTLILLVAEEWVRPVLAPWMVVLIVTREFVINGLRGFVESRGIDFSASWPGKLKMIVQSTAIPSIFLFKIVELWLPEQAFVVTGSRILAVVLIWTAIILTFYSGIEYITKAARLLRTDP